VKAEIRVHRNYLTVIGNYNAEIWENVSRHYLGHLSNHQESRESLEKKRRRDLRTLFTIRFEGSEKSAKLRNNTICP